MREPFTQIYTRVLRDPSLSPLELKVLLYLATYKEPYPPYGLIMNQTGIRSQASVSKAIKGLVEKRYLKVKRGFSVAGKAKANVYELKGVRPEKLSKRISENEKK